MQKRHVPPLALLMMGCLLIAGCNDDQTPPKNVLFFLGDGMGMTTLTAARIYSVGEEGSLTLDTLPETAFIKTYSNDSQVTDSAPSMSAYMTGVKSNNGVISMTTDTLHQATCAPGNGQAKTTLLELAKQAGRGTGVVTTTRVTHATPAATYAHICNRDLENDIAAQFVPGGSGYNNNLMDGVDVLLGGGRSQFLTKSSGGKREDGRDLVSELQAKGYTYASSAAELAATVKGKVVGLFNGSHMSYELDRPASEPSLSEMTDKAIDLLAQNPKGFFLMVEGGRIDHALHDTNAQRALRDTVAFDTALQTAITKMERLDPGLKNTLIVLTADHDHTLVLNGYAKRTGKTTVSQPGVLGLVKNYRDGEPTLDASGMPYSIIGFGNGSNRVVGPRDSAVALDDAAVADKDYRQEAVIDLGEPGSETHGGTDVFLGAMGMGADAFHGWMENANVFNKIRAVSGL